MVRQITCPICNKLLEATAVKESKFFPFCSERCRNVDLLRWCKGKYAIVDPLTPEQLAEHAEAEDVKSLLDDVNQPATQFGSDEDGNDL